MVDERDTVTCARDGRSSIAIAVAPRLPGQKVGMKILSEVECDAGPSVASSTCLSCSVIGWPIDARRRELAETWKHVFGQHHLKSFECRRMFDVDVSSVCRLQLGSGVTTRRYPDLGDIVAQQHKTAGSWYGLSILGSSSTVRNTKGTHLAEACGGKVSQEQL
jgi:hypothetical protein